MALRIFGHGSQRTLSQFGRGSPNAHVCDPEHFGACLNVIVSGALFGFGSIGVILMTKEESALYDRAERLGYKVRRVDREYSLTAMDGSGDGCVGGSDIERIHRWLDQKEAFARTTRTT
jgi:hypothetical protein